MGKELAALYPGRSARVLRRGTPVGWIGELHPALVKALDFTYAPVLFELDMAAFAVKRATFEEISRSLHVLLATGATRIFPTVITGAPGDMLGALKNLYRAKQQIDEAAVIEAAEKRGVDTGIRAFAAAELYLRAWQMDPEDVRRRITSRTKAVMLARRSIEPPHCPVGLDSSSAISLIITDPPET